MIWYDGTNCLSPVSSAHRLISALCSSSLGRLPNVPTPDCFPARNTVGESLTSPTYLSQISPTPLPSDLRLLPVWLPEPDFFFPQVFHCPPRCHSDVPFLPALLRNVSSPVRTCRVLTFGSGAAPVPPVPSTGFTCLLRVPLRLPNWFQDPFARTPPERAALLVSFPFADYTTKGFFFLDRPLCCTGSFFPSLFYLTSTFFLFSLEHLYESTWQLTKVFSTMV